MAELECSEVLLRRIARLLAGDVEADDAAVAVRDGELRHVERIGAVPHRADDLAEGDGVARLGAFEAPRDRVDDVL